MCILSASLIMVMVMVMVRVRVLLVCVLDNSVPAVLRFGTLLAAKMAVVRHAKVGAGAIDLMSM